jgi:hypothetical protein
MGLKVNASDVIPDPNAAAKAKAARPPAKAFAPRGSRAARRVDALLGGGGRVAASSSSSSSSSSFGDYGGDGFGGDGFGGDLSPTLGDTVRIKKTGVVGVVVDVDGGVLSVQSGRNALKSPVEGVEFAPAGGGGGGGGGGKKKQKKQKKKGSGLPSGVAGSAAQKTSSSAPKPSPRGPADVNDLMAKFNRK